MKCIILAGGYAKRLWPLTNYTPKPLLDINGKPIINIILEKINKVHEIDEVFVSTNKKFEAPFRDWIKENHTSGKKMKLILEPTIEESGKFGTIAGISYAIESENIEDDCIVIAGDNLFDFELSDFIAFYEKKRAPVFAVFDIKDFWKAQLYGIVSIDGNNRIVDFVEKPEKAPSTLASTACYIFPKETLHLFKAYIKDGGRKDSPGFFIAWLSKKQPVYAYTFKGHWFDIGDFESLEKAREFMKGKK
ncbi:MAG: nucleotidyltransferase family protein [Candidatus Aenigmarchaeota archaeon]|nr:nucleotidyltransferase family protein [Candidatus Aenigmarchaeota archaeon]